MQVLDWMSHNFFLTIILAGVVSETLIRVFRSGKMLAMKCPKCGFSNVTIVDREED